MPEPVSSGSQTASQIRACLHDLAEVLRDRIEGRTPPAEPQAATFADGVLDMAVVDAIRASATEGREVEVEGL